MVKTCKTCRTTYEYETEDDLRSFFYKKGQWFRNECIKCELLQRRIKYAEGTYNYRKHKNDKYADEYSLGEL